MNILSVAERGAVLLLEWGSFCALLPIDQNFYSLDVLQGEHCLVPVTALLLADSGYAPLNPTEWFQRRNTQVGLLCETTGDRQGGLDGETKQALEVYTVLRTDRNGWIELSTDGERLWVKV